MTSMPQLFLMTSVTVSLHCALFPNIFISSVVFHDALYVLIELVFLIGVLDTAELAFDINGTVREVDVV